MRDRHRRTWRGWSTSPLPPPCRIKEHLFLGHTFGNRRDSCLDSISSVSGKEGPDLKTVPNGYRGSSYFEWSGLKSDPTFIFNTALRKRCCCAHNSCMIMIVTMIMILIIINTITVIITTSLLLPSSPSSLSLSLL